MWVVTGELEGYGSSIEDMGGMRYEYIRVRNEDNKIVNIYNVLALQNVTSELPHALGEEVTIICRSGLVFAIERDGQVSSDVSTINTVWTVVTVFCFGPLVISAILFLLARDHNLAIGGAIFGLVGIITFVKYIKTFFVYFPSSGANEIHRKAVAEGKIATA